MTTVIIVALMRGTNLMPSNYGYRMCICGCRSTSHKKVTVSTFIRHVCKNRETCGCVSFRPKGDPGKRAERQRRSITGAISPPSLYDAWCAFKSDLSREMGEDVGDGVALSAVLTAGLSALDYDWEGRGETDEYPRVRRKRGQ